jgi:hypothetical protein
MVSALLAGALIAGASLACGQAVMAFSGRDRLSPVAPAAGLSVLLVVCGVAVKLPGHATTAAVAAGLACALAAWVLAPRRGRLGQVSAGAVAAALIAAAVVAIPFAVSGRIGILGQGLVNDDMASHLLFTEWIDTRSGPTPDLIDDGYPLGPHAIVAAAAKASGAGLIEAFAGLTGAIAVLTALTAYGALGGVRSVLRAPAAALVALPYLGAAYLAQGAFKEPMLALALLGFGLSLPALAESWSGHRPALASTLPDRGRRWLRSQALLALPGGVIAAGTIYNYSFPGLAWLALAAVAWALLVARYERDRRGGMALRARVKWARPLIAAGVAIPLIAAVPEIVRILSFAGFEAFSPSGTEGNTGFGNLRQALNPLESLGVWPSSEFRVAPENSSTPVAAFYLGGLLALAAFGWGAGRAIARREAALPAAVAAGAAGYLVALAAGTPYTSAKALAVAAPVVMVISLRGLLGASSLEGEEAAEASWWPPRLVRPLVRLGIPALAVAFVAAAAFSTLLPLRQPAVGPTSTADGLIADFRPLVEGEDVLFLGRDNFISWELLGANDVFAPIVNYYDTEETPTLYRATTQNAKFDWDNVPDQTLAEFDYVLTTSAAFNSQAPPEFSEAERSGNFVLWERNAPAPEPGRPGSRRTLLEPLYPGAVLDCSGPRNQVVRELDGSASALAKQPVIGEEWERSPEITEAAPATETLELTPGRWEISIQYASTQDLRLTAPAPGLDVTLDANLLFRGPSPFYPAGTIEVPQSRRGDGVPIEFTASVDRPPLAGRLLGTESRAYLGTIAAMPTERAAGGLPLSQACGLYVDWYTLASGAPAAGVDALDGPAPRPPQSEE